MITFSAPGKIHLLGEHSAVYGKPALLASIGLRVFVTISKGPPNDNPLKQIIEPIIRKQLKIKTIPSYNLTISSQIPKSCGLGSSAAVSASYIAALLSFLKINWDLNLVNNLTYQAEKVFHGNPSGGDNTTVVNGGLLWFEKGKLPLFINSKIKTFILIYSGKPAESTKEMIKNAKPKISSILEDQASLTKQLALALKDGNGGKLVAIIRKGERNLEKIGVVGKKAKKIIKEIESLDGAAKISGAGGVKTGSGMIVSYHENPKKMLKYAKQNNLKNFIIKLGEEGLRQQS